MLRGVVDVRVRVGLRCRCLVRKVRVGVVVRILVVNVERRFYLDIVVTARLFTVLVVVIGIDARVDETLVVAQGNHFVLIVVVILVILVLRVAAAFALLLLEGLLREEVLLFHFLNAVVAVQQLALGKLAQQLRYLLLEVLHRREIQVVFLAEIERQLVRVRTRKDLYVLVLAFLELQSHFEERLRLFQCRRRRKRRVK